jgi:hypothetical protein
MLKGALRFDVPQLKGPRNNRAILMSPIPLLVADRNDGTKSHGMLNIDRSAKLSCRFTPEILVKKKAV